MLKALHEGQDDLPGISAACTGSLAAIEEELVKVHLWRPKTTYTWPDIVSIALLVSVSGLGVRKLLVGIGRDRPVEFLVMLLLVTGVEGANPGPLQRGLRLLARCLR